MKTQWVGLAYKHYRSVELKGYVTARKQPEAKN